MTLNRHLNIEDLRQRARRGLPGFAFDYLDGGAEDEYSLQHNRAIFRNWRFQSTTLVDTRDGTLAASLLGSPTAAP